MVSSVLGEIQNLDPATAQTIKDVVNGEQYGLQFPFLTDPQQTVFRLLMGQNVPLVTYDMEPLTLDLQATFGIDVGLFGVSLTGGLDSKRI